MIYLNYSFTAIAHWVQHLCLSFYRFLTEIPALVLALRPACGLLGADILADVCEIDGVPRRYWTVHWKGPPVSCLSLYVQCQTRLPFLCAPQLPIVHYPCVSHLPVRLQNTRTLSCFFKLAVCASTTGPAHHADIGFIVLAQAAPWHWPR